MLQGRQKRFSEIIPKYDIFIFVGIYFKTSLLY